MENKKRRQKHLQLVQGKKRPSSNSQEIHNLSNNPGKKQKKPSGAKKNAKPTKWTDLASLNEQIQDKIRTSSCKLKEEAKQKIEDSRYNLRKKQLIQKLKNKVKRN
ncbi:hypothetical protein GVAV_000816 [Gurleya vavrai]